MSRRSGILEFAVLGLLRESPMHGYELRKRLNTSLGVFRAFSYGTLYPCLKTLVANGWLIEEPGNVDEAAASLTGRRAKIVYRLTAEGKEHFEQLLSQTGPDAYEDETFAARFAFFGQTSRDVAHARARGPSQSAGGAPGEDERLLGAYPGAAR